MKALVKKEAKKGIWLEEVQKPSCKHDEVLIKVKKAAICGTDIHIYNWDSWAQNNIQIGRIIGHEFSGIITALGENTKGLKIGDLVSAEGHIVCNHCRKCTAGLKHLCENTIGVGVSCDGAFAEYLVVPSANVWKEPANFNSDILAFYDAFGNATHTAFSFNCLGEDVLISGAGPIGLMATAIAKYAGARSVVVTDINPYRLELATKMGADAVVNVAHEDIKSYFDKLKIHSGFDLGFEMSGSPKALENMIDLMVSGGKICLLGILPSNTHVNFEKVIFKALTLKGIYGREIFDTWYKMDRMIEGGLDLSLIITHRFHYTEFQKAFEVMDSGKSAKVILDWD